MFTAVLDAGNACVTRTSPSTFVSRTCATSSAVVSGTGLRAPAMPAVGELTLDCDVLTVAGSDLRLVVYTAAPGSPDACALALLGAVGLQSFAP